MIASVLGVKIFQPTFNCILTSPLHGMAVWRVTEIYERFYVSINARFWHMSIIRSYLFSPTVSL